MEDYLSENDSVDIREWAQQIHTQKIQELKNKIAFKQEILNGLKASKPATPESSLHKVLAQTKLVEDVCKLKDKLRILER